MTDHTPSVEANELPAGFDLQLANETMRMLGQRERHEVVEAETEGVETESAEATLDKAAIAARVGPKGYDLIVGFETGGRRHYDGVIKARPIWPGYASGITIGFGYDLGYHSRAEIERDWARLGAATVARLVTVAGRNSGRDKQTPAQMKALLAPLLDIKVTWEASEPVFRAATLPKYASGTWRTLPNCDLLPGDAFGALVSIGFNRGNAWSNDDDRFREMREIREAMDKRQFAKIPGLIRAMTRIWVGTNIETGMRRRRNAEAKLFEEALAGQPVAVVSRALAAVQPVAVAVSPARPFVPASTRPQDGGVEGTAESAVESASAADDSTSTAPGDEDAWSDETEEQAVEAARSAPTTESTLESAASARVTWAADAVSPDYAHLKLTGGQGTNFEITAADLMLLCRANSFPVDPASDAPVLFGLRGATIVAGDATASAAASASATLKDTRPDHDNLRCVMGVWFPKAGTLAVFPGSTVPNSKAVLKWLSSRSAGNMLPTGFYRYICGPHVTAGSNVPGSFLLRNERWEKRNVVVRRSSDDATYEVSDAYMVNAPGDNIHCTFSTSMSYFSSFGCQTVRGNGSTAGHTDSWASFRKVAGLRDTDGEPGKAFVYMLLTGAEARLASELRRSGLAGDPVETGKLRRLRFGSSGPLVSKLQTALGLASPDGTMGPNTTKALYDRQAGAARGASDGILTPELDQALGFGVFPFTGV
jgi:hypothetical protein